MRMISYAGNREDVLLHRLFGDQQTGYYVDVGAGDPKDHSVTKHFYDSGWSGLNVEPSERLFRRLVANRTRDVNVNAAVSDEPGTVTFYECEPDYWGFSTLSASQAEAHRSAGVEVAERQVEVTTLAQVLEKYAVPDSIDFLSVDVEGFEEQVLAGADWSRWRPRVVLVEATEPMTSTPTHQRWEHHLTGAGYDFAYFDGLNRYYLRSEDAELASRFQTPVNVFDGYEPYEWVRQVDAAQGRLLAETVLRQAAEAELEAVWADRTHLRHRLRELAARYADLEQAQGRPGDPGPIAMTVARTLVRVAQRYPGMARYARVVLGTAIKARRKLTDLRSRS